MLLIKKEIINKLKMKKKIIVLKIKITIQLYLNYLKIKIFFKKDTMPLYVFTNLLLE